MFNSKPILVVVISMVVQLAHAQPISVPESRIEMAMEWVKTSRPVLRSLGETTPASSKGGASLPADATSISEADRTVVAVNAVWSIELLDKRLSSVIQRWAAQSGWQLVWEAERDFLIDAALHVEGDFLFAVDATMRALAETDYPLQAIANKKTRVLRVIRYQDIGSR